MIDWEKQWECSIDPETAKSIREAAPCAANSAQLEARIRPLQANISIYSKQ